MSRSSSRPPELLAAVDLGSNSFHCVVARLVGQRVEIVEHLRESVRLASRMRDDGRLDETATTRALDCLARFGARLREYRPRRARAVGTYALRTAREVDSFLQRASQTLGVPIDIVSGEEEARLIYRGVIDPEGEVGLRQLVIDVGGGSTEIVLGRGTQPDELYSLPIGCVTLSERFFPSGRVSMEGMSSAREVVREMLLPVVQGCLVRGWDVALASSGSVQAIRDALRELPSDENAIRSSTLHTLLERAVNVEDLRELGLSSLDPERQRLFGGGLAILLETFASLRLARLEVSDRAMRDGILLEMVTSATVTDREG